MERIYRAASALGLRLPNGSKSRHVVVVATATVLSLTLVPVGSVMAAGNLTSAKVDLSDPQPGATGVTYTVTASGVDGATAIKCVKLVWSTTASGDTAPSGFSGASGGVDAANSTLVNSSATNWSLAKSDGTSSTGQNNIYKYTNSASGVTPSTTTAATFVITGLTNPSTPNANAYFTLRTYTNTDCATGPVDYANLQFIVTPGSTMSMTVDPTLSFTVNTVPQNTSCNGQNTTATSSPTTIPFGNVTPAGNAIVCQDLTAATNATHGYSIYIRYTGAPSNGLQSIADFPHDNSAPANFSSAGTEAYGYTTSDSDLGTGTADRFTTGGPNYAKATTSNEEIAYQATGANSVTYHIGHEVGVSTLTQPGTYSTTVIYTCTPVF